MDRLAAMQTFVRVVETGSFSAVAREMNSTQSAISKQVAALEKHLGARLMTRTTRALTLTDDGRRYFEEARRLTSEIDEAESALRGGERHLSGWLRIAAPVGFGRLVLMPHVKSFLGTHADVRIDLRLDDRYVDLVEDGIDVAVRIGELADSSLIARTIGWSHRALVASRVYVERAGVPHSPAELATHNCIVYTERAGRSHWRFHAEPGMAIDAADDGDAVEVTGNLQTNSSEVVRAAVLSDMGIVYAPTWLFGDELARGEVQLLLPERPFIASPVHLVSPPQRRQSAKVRAFAEHVAAGLAASGLLAK